MWTHGSRFLNLTFVAVDRQIIFRRGVGSETVHYFRGRFSKATFLLSAPFCNSFYCTRETLIRSRRKGLSRSVWPPDFDPYPSSSYRTRPWDYIAKLALFWNIIAPENQTVANDFLTMIITYVVRRWQIRLEEDWWHVIIVGDPAQE